MSIEAMSLAQDFIERTSSYLPTTFDTEGLAIHTALRQAIEQAQKQEPVAWMFQHEETGRTICVDAQQLEWGFEKGNPRLKKVAPLYTTPPQRTWLGLTDVELSDLSASGLSLWGLWRAIEAKLKEKNT